MLWFLFLLCLCLATPGSTFTGQHNHFSLTNKRYNGRRTHVAGAAIAIQFCEGCNWGLRASWMAQELLFTFNAGEISEIKLIPMYLDEFVLINKPLCLFFAKLFLFLFYVTVFKIFDDSVTSRATPATI